MKNLVLVGFMGSGKTSAGRRAAPRLGLQFVDMDAVIVERAGQTIADIFATEGEPAFRKLERDLVRELSQQQGLLIATGGGIILDPDNLRDFSATGIVICCWIDAATAHERTKHARHRPLLEAAESEADRRARLEQLLHSREALYRAIPIQINATTLSVEQQADVIERIYRERN